jgi:hypothetical protein
MPKYPGRIVSATPPSVSLSGASGVWTLEEVAQYEQAGTWPVGVAGGDPYFNQTVLLLHGDGTNGAQNNTFLDSSANNFTITRNPANGPNAPTQGTFSPFSGPNGYWSNFFDGNGGTTANTDKLTIANNAAFQFGSGDFTIECWVYLTATPTTACRILDKEAVGQDEFLVAISSATNLIFGYSTTGSGITNVNFTGVFTVGQWTHLVITRSGSTLEVFQNGVSLGTSTLTATIRAGTASLYIGNAYFDERTFPGYISNLKIIKGTAVNPSGVPTTPLVDSSGTSLLTCQSNRFVDNSTNAFAITRNGDVRVTPFSPFAPSAAYSAGTNGGSGYFDGSGDYLTVGSASDWTFLSNGSDWTCEFWMYHSTTEFDGVLSTNAWTNAGAGWNVYANLTTANTITVEFMRGVAASSAAFVSSAVLKINQWNHVAITFTSSTKTCTFAINGESAGSSSNTGFAYSASDPPTTLAIGRFQGTGGATPPGGDYTGYLSNIRISTNVRTGLTSVPTAPYTSDANTKLLLNFTNAGIFDQTGKNNLETVGNAQVDTSVKKFGTGSLKFDGTGDWLDIPPTPDLYLSTGDFTIEGWVYTNNSSVNQQIMIRRASAAARGIAGNINASSANKLTFVFGDTNTVAFEVTLTSTTSLSNNVWYHFAVVRSGNNFALYINGVSEATATSSVVIADDTSKLRIGADDSGTSSLNGYIDDLRITKGVARYPTEPFPTAPFPDL